jgi:transcriptional regulator with XRE-family HTH domain
MLGNTVREARIRKQLTQDRLAKAAGVSRRHLASLEKGANVSVSVLQRVAAVLELTEIQLGELSLRPADRAEVNVPLLTDAIREARAEAEKAQATLARVEGLLEEAPRRVEVAFPRLPVRRLDATAVSDEGEIREGQDALEVETAGEIRQGEPVDETKKETVALPHSLVEDGEIVFRARGEGMRDQGIEDGDLLVVELRPRGRAANGELTVGRIGKRVWVGWWWQKHGQKALMSHGLAEVVVGRALKVVAAVNAIVRG